MPRLLLFRFKFNLPRTHPSWLRHYRHVGVNKHRTFLRRIAVSAILARPVFPFLMVTVVVNPRRVPHPAVPTSVHSLRPQSGYLIFLVHMLLILCLIHSPTTGSQLFLQSLLNHDGVVVTITTAIAISTVNSRTCSLFHRVTQRN